MLGQPPAILHRTQRENNLCKSLSVNESRKTVCDFIFEKDPRGTPSRGLPRGQIGVNIRHKIRMLDEIIFIDSTGENRSSIPEGGQW